MSHTIDENIRECFGNIGKPLILKLFPLAICKKRIVKDRIKMMSAKDVKLNDGHTSFEKDVKLKIRKTLSVSDVELDFSGLPGLGRP